MPEKNFVHPLLLVHTFLIVSDSLSGLSPISNVHSSHHLVTGTHTLLTTLVSLPPLHQLYLGTSAIGESKAMNLLTQPPKPLSTSPASKTVIYPQNPISFFVYVRITDHWMYLRQKRVSASNKLAQIEPFPISWSLSHHTKSILHDSVSATLNSLTITFSPKDSPFHVNIVDLIRPLTPCSPNPPPPEGISLQRPPTSNISMQPISPD